MTDHHYKVQLDNSEKNTLMFQNNTVQNTSISLEILTLICVASELTDSVRNVLGEERVHLCLKGIS